ncbi:MAG: Bifunctional phosphoglucose/phosphomannose isomerase [Methanomassiliicoccales archaeon PtaU1.Bin124]|nr:MAG: Bifunctional phosphoglucose/phosphomannose isomerase [Methanomassiliicoccales archaeon PtaU1.Bin124]
MLDDPKVIASADPTRMGDQVKTFIPNLIEATSFKGPITSTPNRICLSGIGGSAMASDFLSDLLYGVSPVALYVNRGVTLPHWVGKDDVSIITSYSGNTQEALDVLQSSQKVGCKICCITCGGNMLDICERESLPHIKVPGGMQPRAALGYLLGAAAAALEGMGAGRPASELRAAAKNSITAAERMGPASPTEKNVAKKLASMMTQNIPIIYAPRNIRSVAVRWQNQINENSKMLAFSGEVPEMNHNQLVGWLQGDKCSSCRPVFLIPSIMDPTVEKMTMVTIQMFNDRGLDPLVVPLHGNTPAENLISGIILGDYLSYYLAILRGADPGPVPAIQEFKKRIA